ncbi:2Fe-2S iron-sulfur cluster binding domain-containing protein [Mucilaginibacter pineti]|uniref:2Fe-2S iron-sulfur cluster binding domain-containing protein n=1 Tax=Mucilaginibacter pineti TaxID=1391627 RepID=A0A1G7DJ49_9SPHI|nr:2Fe-2S iron-sulfur cluster-binding protein [Mucilaginibacter pineti]SDE51564.1 2Fe-2S iron-sulfur cluster binding domain-containing protein [Mucilaginibacter pineti]
MNMEEATIIFSLHFKNEDHIIRTYQNEYYSLMTLISAILPVSGFGLCCGMGSCGTCLVEISNKERSYKKPVLACSIAINDQLANMVVLIPDSGY